MKWIPINARKPRLGQKCYCYFVMERYDGTILKDTRLLHYLKLRRDNRKHVFSDKNELWHDMNIGETNWPVTHWMPEPDAPNQLLEPTTKACAIKTNERGGSVQSLGFSRT